VTRRRPRTKRRADKAHLDPYLAYLVFVAVGAGTYRMGQDLRLTLLWVVLLGTILVLAEGRSVGIEYTWAKAGQGATVGLLLSLPLLILAWEPLQVTVARLYPLGSGIALFQGVVLVAVPVEEIFFRANLRQEHGFWVAAGLYGLAGTVFFLPIMAAFPIVLAVVTVGMAILGVLYGYVALRYGLAASIACHAVVNLVLFVLPVILGSLGDKL